MKTIRTIIRTDACKYALLAFVLASVAFFAVLPLISDIQPEGNGPSLMALLAKAEGDDGGGEGGGEGGGGCCGGGEGGGEGGGNPPPPPPAPVCTPVWYGCGAYWYQNSCVMSCPQGTQPDRVTGPDDNQYCGQSYNTCTPVPVVAQPSCTITATPNPCTIANGQSTCTATISWTTQHMNNPAVYVNGTLFANSISGTQAAPWITEERATFVVRERWDFSPPSPTICSVTVRGNQTTPPPVTPAPTCSIFINPNSITQGQNATLSWDSSNATSLSIDQGIGSVATYGSRTITPSQTTRYTVTATGPGGTITCSRTITVTPVVPPPTPAPTCALEAVPSNLTSGQSSVLSWTTTNASNVTINQSIGAVQTSGSRTVTPTQTTTYTLTATGPGGSVNCTRTVTVTVPTPAPTCTLDASPSSITRGQNSTLTWTTSNASSVTIDQGIGSVAVSGSRAVTPSVTTTYTLTATGAGGSVNCTRTVTVTVPTPAPTCTLDASPSSMMQGQSSTLSWNTTNATQVTLNQGIGIVTTSGTRTVAPGETTIYTLTATGAGGTVTCTKTITVTPRPSAPTCTLNANPSTVARGGVSTLSWTTTNASSITLTPVSDSRFVPGANGSYNVAPTETTTYTLTATGPGGTAICTKVVTVSVPTPAPTCTLDANPATITRGGVSLLSWTTTNAASVIITNISDRRISTFPLSGSYNVAPTETTIYTLTATGAGGTVTCTKTVVVSTPNPAPTCTLDASPSSITQGQSSTLTWTTSNASSVTIDQGIGSVAVSGSRSVTPNVTTTYTLTATGAGGTVTCTKSVMVNNQPPAPSCTLSINPARITKGGSATLTWSTANAAVVSIDQGVGSVAVNGSRSVSPSANTTYTLTARESTQDNARTVTCVASIVVENEPEPEPLRCDAFSASPSTLTTSGTTTLMWNTSNATAVSINNGVGNVSVDGSQTVNVSTTTTYTLTATRGSENVTCNTTVTVAPVPVVPKCDAFTVSPTSVRSGNNATLSWNTTNATAVTINNGIGNVAVDGTMTVSPNDDTTYTLTATNGSASDTCQVTLDVTSGGGGGGGGGSSAPKCSFKASDRKISAGEKVTLSWNNTRTNDVIIKDNRGNVLADTKKNRGEKVDADKDSIDVRPTRSTSYTLTAIRGSRDRDCTVDIDVEDVSVTSKRTQVAGISLSRVPYTGFDAGPMLTAFFYSLIVLWGLGIAYVLVYRNGTIFGFSLKRNAAASTTFEAVPTPTAPRIDPIFVAPTVTKAPERYEAPAYTPVYGYENLYVSAAPVASATETVALEEEEISVEGDTLARLESRAHEARVLISSEALRFVIGQTTDETEQTEILDLVIALAKASYPAENGWVIVNKERILSLLK